VARLFDLTGKVALVTAPRRAGARDGAGACEGRLRPGVVRPDAGGFGNPGGSGEAGVPAGTFAMDVLRPGNVRDAVAAVVAAFGKDRRPREQRGVNVRKPALELSEESGTGSSTPT